MLVLEDEVLIGIDIHDELREAGYRVAGPFTTCADALEWLRTSTPDAALKDGSCREIARELERRVVPFLIYSGYGEGLWNQAEVRRLPVHRSPVGQGLPGRSRSELHSPGSPGSRELIRTSRGVL